MRTLNIVDIDHGSEPTPGERSKRSVGESPRRGRREHPGVRTSRAARSCSPTHRAGPTFGADDFAATDIRARIGGWLLLREQARRGPSKEAHRRAPVRPRQHLVRRPTERRGRERLLSRTRGMTTGSGIWASRTMQRMRPSPGTRSATRLRRLHRSACSRVSIELPMATH